MKMKVSIERESGKTERWDVPDVENYYIMLHTMLECVGWQESSDNDYGIYKLRSEDPQTLWEWITGLFKG